MNRNLGAALAVLGVVGIGFVAWQGFERNSLERTKSVLPPPNARPTAAQLSEERSRLEQLEKVSPEKLPLVHQRRIALAYAVANTGDFSKARKELTRVAPLDLKSDWSTVKWTGLQEEAIYQALVCLANEGKVEDAKAGFRKILEERPSSAVAAHAFKRLTKLGAGQNDPNDVQRMNLAVRAGEEKHQRDIAACGPKAIQWLVHHRTGTTPPLAEVQERTKQDVTGASVKDMLAALKSYGLRGTAAELNAADFNSARLPLILLDKSHYVVVTSRANRQMVLFDPMTDSVRTSPLPASNDPDFRAVAIQF